MNWTFTINRTIRRACAGGAQTRAVAELLGLTGRGGTERLYRRFRLRLSAGEVVAVVGPSGAGKSSLLRAILAKAPDAIVVDSAWLAGCDLPAIEAMESDSGMGVPPMRHRGVSPLQSGQASTGETPVRHMGKTGTPNAMDRVLGPLPMLPLRQRLVILSRCGLAEAAALTTPARRLSGGQLFRLALARAIWQASVSARPRLLLIDEFAATLDSATGAVLAGQLTKLARRYRLGIVVSTPRQELLPAMSPARVVVKPLGGPAKLVEWKEEAWARRPCDAWARCPCHEPRPRHDPGRWPIVAGSLDDYRTLGQFHYLAGPPAAHKRVWVIRVPARQRMLGGPEVAAVLVVSPPTLGCRGRNVATGRRYVGPPRRRGPSIAHLNREVETISRVIVHPVYRSCGLALRLVRHALAHAGSPLVESLAAMGAVHPFFELAGMTCLGRFQGAGKHYCYYLAVTARPWRSAQANRPARRTIPAFLKRWPHRHAWVLTGLVRRPPATKIPAFLLSA